MDPIRRSTYPFCHGERRAVPNAHCSEASFVRCPGQGAPSARETTIGRGFPSPYQPDKGRSAIYRTDLGPDSCWYALCAAIVGNRGKRSGESRLEGARAPLAVVADKTFGSRAIRQLIADDGALAVIPSKSNAREPIPHDAVSTKCATSWSASSAP